MKEFMVWICSIASLRYFDVLILVKVMKLFKVICVCLILLLY